MVKTLIDINDISSFMTRSGFAINLHVEGVHGYVFGCRAGTQYDGFNLAHEIAHVIELGSIRSRRFEGGNLNFKTNRTWCCDRFVCEPSTDSMSRRELRTFVIQYQIMVASGVMADKEDFLETICPLFAHMPDSYYFYKGTQSGMQVSKEFKEFVAKEFDAILNQWSLKKIMKIWKSIKLL